MLQDLITGAGVHDHLPLGVRRELHHDTAALMLVGESHPGDISAIISTHQALQVLVAQDLHSSEMLLSIAM